MSRLVPITVVLAVAWAVVTHPLQLVYTLGGFAAGMAFTSSLPWFVRWAQGLVKDTEGTGGPAVPNTPLSTQRGQASNPDKGVRIPVNVPAPTSPEAQRTSAADLERGRRDTVAAFEAAGIPVPPEARVPISQTEPILALQQHAIALGALRVSMRHHAPAQAASLPPVGQPSRKPWSN